MNEYIDTPLIYEMFTGAEQFQRESNQMQWWNQDYIWAEGANGFSAKDEDEVE